MNGEKSDIEEVTEDDVADELLTETVVIVEDDPDEVGDLSVELNVEKLVAKLEAADEDDVHEKAEIRRRLEELNEQREKELDSTFNFDLDEDV